MKKEILERLENLEKVALELEPGQELRKGMQEKVTDYAENFLEELDELPGFVETETKGKGIRDLQVNEKGHSLDDMLALLKREVDTPGLNPASGGHLGYIPGGGLFPSALGDFLADVSNRYAGIFFGSPGAVRMENMLLEWMAGLVGFGAGFAGTHTSGGSIANLTGIVTARDAKGIHSTILPDSVIYMTGQVHHCVDKAIRIAGLGEAMIRHIPMDERFRMDPQALEKQVQADLRTGLKPFLLVASAGTTDTGAVDPIRPLARIAQAHDLWLHVDAAYGGFFLLAEETKALLEPLYLADSVVLDPHKGLFLPYGSGALLVKNGEFLGKSHYYQANYMQDAQRATDELSPADLSAELTRPFRGMRMWMPLMLFGTRPFKAALSEKIWLARYFYEAIQEEANFEVGPYPELSVMMFRWVPEGGEANAANAALVEAIQKDGRVFLSSTFLEETFWIRLAVLSFRTHRKTIELALTVIREKVKELQRQFGK